MITGISHITYIVEDLDRATLFFEEIFDAKAVYSSEDRQYSISKEKFFLIGDIWLAIMEGDKRLEKSYNHIAFHVSENDFGLYSNRVESLGVEIKAARHRIGGEGDSIYFYDFDNHLFEIHTGTLDDRLKSYSRDK